MKKSFITNLLKQYMEEKGLARALFGNSHYIKGLEKIYNTCHQINEEDDLPIATLLEITHFCLFGFSEYRTGYSFFNKLRSNIFT